MSIKLQINYYGGSNVKTDDTKKKTEDKSENTTDDTTDDTTKEKLSNIVSNLKQDSDKESDKDEEKLNEEEDVVNEKSIPELVLNDKNTDDIIKIIQRNILNIKMEEELTDEINDKVKKLIIKASDEKLEPKEKLNIFKDLVKAVIKHNLTQVKGLNSDSQEVINLILQAGNTNKKLLARLQFSKLALKIALRNTDIMKFLNTDLRLKDKLKLVIISLLAVSLLKFSSKTSKKIQEIEKKEFNKMTFTRYIDTNFNEELKIFIKEKYEGNFLEYLDEKNNKNFDNYLLRLRKSKIKEITDSIKNHFKDDFRNYEYIKYKNIKDHFKEFSEKLKKDPKIGKVVNLITTASGDFTSDSKEMIIELIFFFLSKKPYKNLLKKFIDDDNAYELCFGEDGYFITLINKVYDEYDTKAKITDIIRIIKEILIVIAENSNKTVEKTPSKKTSFKKAGERVITKNKLKSKFSEVKDKQKVINSLKKTKEMSDSKKKLQKGVKKIIAANKLKSEKKEEESDESKSMPISDSQKIREDFSSKQIRALFLFAITFNITTTAVFYGLDIVAPLIDFLNQNPTFQKIFGPNGEFAKSPMGKKFNKTFGKRGAFAKFIYKIKMFFKNLFKKKKNQIGGGEITEDMIYYYKYIKYKTKYNKLKKLDI